MRLIHVLIFTFAGIHDLLRLEMLTPYRPPDFHLLDLLLLFDILFGEFVLDGILLDKLFLFDLSCFGYADTGRNFLCLTNLLILVQIIGA